MNIDFRVKSKGKVEFKYSICGPHEYELGKSFETTNDQDGGKGLRSQILT